MENEQEKRPADQGREAEVDEKSRAEEEIAEAGGAAPGFVELTYQSDDDATRMVREFMDRIGSPPPSVLSDDLHEPHVEMDDATLEYARAMLHIVEMALRGASTRHHGQRRFRTYLAVHEIREMVEAMIARDESKLLDSLNDVDCVIHGTAAQYDLPMGAGIAEVMRSNMTKEPGLGADGHDGDRGKGAGYRPPDMRTVIEAERAARHCWKEDGDV